MGEEKAVSVIDEASDIYWDNIKKTDNATKRLSVHDIRQIFDLAVKPAIESVRKLDRASAPDMLKRIEELEQRLEINEFGIDGIECRDETIKLQDGRIERQADQIALLESELLDTRRHAIELTEALKAINNLIGEDAHVKMEIKAVDDILSIYSGLTGG